jgi:DEAD/DEAH box helicase domain-containing protein
MVTAPPSMKSFWQRFGRAGRKRSGVCLLIDDGHHIREDDDGLQVYLQRPIEPAWLYLDNTFIQYSQVLCAAQEAAEMERASPNMEPFRSLPSQFIKLLENEVNQTESIPEELYLLKQRALSNPHHEFPLRSGVEQSFVVRDRRSPGPDHLGSLSLSQALREAYPGAIYYYMARPYRIERVHYRKGEIYAQKSKRWTTRPTQHTIVFPKIPGGELWSRRSDAGFVCETALQVSERVTGFVEQRGNNKTSHQYGPDSPYSRKPLVRFFETTGVCWYFGDKALHSEAIGSALLEAFCVTCSVQERDVGMSTFSLKTSQFWPSAVSGTCIFDSVHGSLRLTQQLALRFHEIAEAAIELVRTRDADELLANQLAALREQFARTQPAVASANDGEGTSQDDWIQVIADNQPAILSETADDVFVLGRFFGPQGLMYELRPARPGVLWRVKSALVRPINGETEMVWINSVSGEKREVSDAGAAGP